jgi:hypothetical protein
MKTSLTRLCDYISLAAGIALLTFACASFTQSATAQTSTCRANPPRNCIWDVVDSFCQHVGACSSGTGCGCVDALPFTRPCCYVEIGTIDSSSCPQSGCTTFKKCCLGNCHN